MNNGVSAKIVIDTQTQCLSFYHEGQVKKIAVSTAKNGTGQQLGSGCTPLGRHQIAQKIGAGSPCNSVFVGRVPTGEIYDGALAAAYPNRDWILTRILWLRGLEAGFNQGENALGVCDTYRRFIYIHGTPDTEPMGIPLSHGCIRMHNEDLLWLFEQVWVGTLVDII